MRTNSHYFVLTGAPCSGKSSAVRCLSRMGYNTQPEAARMAADQLISEGIPKDEVKDHPRFQNLIVTYDKMNWEFASDDDIVFFDRSVIDSVAFGYEPVQDLSGWYDKIFFMDRLPIKNDYIRDEDEEEADRIHNDLLEIYSDYGYEIVSVPVLPVRERAAFVLRNLF